MIHRLCCVVVLGGCLSAIPLALADESLTPDTGAVADTSVTPAPMDKPALSTRPTLVEKLKDQRPSERTAAPAIGTMLLGLAATLGLIFLLAWMSKRLRMGAGPMGGELRLVDAMALGPREKVCVIVHSGKTYVLGVTQHTITLLDSGEGEPAPSSRDTLFSEKIKKMLQNGAAHGA